MAVDIPTLERTRGGYKGQLTKYLNIIETHETGIKFLTPEECENYLFKLNRLDNISSTLSDQVFALCKSDDETNKAVDNATDFETRLISITSRYKIAFKTFGVACTSTTAAATTAALKSIVKLPTIQLPTFSGRYEEWQSFQDLFVATVDNNTSLTGAQKLQYLKSCVTGDAALLIKSFTVTDDHYREAWTLLSERYDNVREIVHSLIQKMWHQAPTTTESATDIRRILDETMECIRSLKVLSRPVEHWDDMLVFLLLGKLDSVTRREWAKTLRGTDPPTFKELQEFLEQHLRGLQAGEIKISKTNNNSVPNSNHSSSSFTSNKNNSSGQQSTSREPVSCVICKANHSIFHCTSFKSMSVEERCKLVRSHNICSNCLSSHHITKNCSSKSTCRQCGKRHNSLLHWERPGVKSAPTSAPTAGANHSTSSAHTSTIQTQTLLKTALVKIKASDGNHHTFRAFLDDGAESSFISEECIQLLKLKKEKCPVSISGLGGASLGSAKKKVSVSLSSLIHNSTMEFDALVVPRVTAPLPKLPCDKKEWDHIKGLQLADPNFHIPNKIDILLGGDEVAALLLPGIKTGPRNTPIAQNTVLGWVLLGRTQVKSTNIINIHHADLGLDGILEKFWKVEEIPPVRYLTPEEKKCEDHFASTHSRHTSGRYIVQLPFNDKLSSLGTSREQAFRRFMSLEKRFIKYPEHAVAYKKFMQDYEDLGHMQIIPKDKIHNHPNFYLPHHFVLKENSSSTKLRVVFDGSAKSSSGLSLNQVLMVGPTLQDDLFALILRFRTHLIALKADIVKMYRQFMVSQGDIDFQRILWRDSPDKPIREYTLNTITYGTGSAPYQAVKCSQQLAKDNQVQFPIASQIILKDMYVDDLITGFNTPEEAITAHNQILQVMKSGGMEMKKWMSNDATVLNAIQPELREMNDMVEFDDSLTLAALGVKWTPSKDTFSFTVAKSTVKTRITKRILLSELAKVFDPLGFLSPTTIKAKIIFQDLWKQKIGWDEPLDHNLQETWSNYQKELVHIQSIFIPRCIIIPKMIFQELQGFSDASQKAYAAVVYMKTISADGARSIKLIAAKTRVSPVKQVSIPRLELCGAVLLNELISSIIQSCQFTGPVTAFTDSTTVLRWLGSYPSRWKTFVANRVATIQENLPLQNWRYVKSEDNPADLPSKGITAEGLKSSSLWWQGPSWLLELDNVPYPTPNDNNQIPEEKKTVQVSHSQIDEILLNRFSSLGVLVRVVAYQRRFIYNARKVNIAKKKGFLNTEELKSSLNCLIKQVQNTSFYEEIKKLKSNKAIPTKSKILQLNPFLDEGGILRVGGRLHNSSISEEKKHPIILPHNSAFTVLVIRQCHFQTLHGGFQLVFTTLARNYWIIRARDTIRHLVRKCITCRKQKAKLTTQLMGSLPVSRVTPGQPFINCGVDFAGPFQLLNSTGKGAKTFKGYFAVFVCFATKAIHLEVVTNLTSEAFVACFKRFSARRGIPSHMFSDNGTNFVGAEEELRNFIQSKDNQDQVTHNLADQGTQWHFNPPASPHQGGLWESGVKAVKYHLRRCYGASHLTVEEFGTLLCCIEAILNSRPLCAMSPDPSDLDVLTPGHFLIGRPLNSVPDEDLTDIKINRLSRWQRVQQMSRHFWKRWSTEYLTSLQQRFKWTQKRANVAVDDLVLVHEDNQPPSKWKLGRVVEIHPGADQLVRVVTLRTINGEIKRPIVNWRDLIDSEAVADSNSQKIRRGPKNLDSSSNPQKKRRGTNPLNSSSTHLLEFSIV